jgi:hypothetical protein
MTYMQSNLAFASGIQELSVDEIGFVSGGMINAPPGSPLLGINSWVPDCLENWYYGRHYGGGGLWFNYEGWGVYSAWDKNGDRVGSFGLTTADKATNVIGGGQDQVVPGVGTSGGGSVYVRPIGPL